MGRFKEIISEEKKNMPEYQFKFLYHRVMPGFIFILGGAIVTLGLGIGLSIIFQSKIILFIPLILWGIITIVLLVLFVIYNRKYSFMLIENKAKEFEKIYKLVDYGSVVSKLIDKKIINCDNIFIEKNSFLLQDLYFVFFCKTLSGVYYFRINIYKKSDNGFVGLLELDKYLCSYFYENLNLIVNNELFKLFMNDKKTFLRYLYKYNDAFKMQKKYLKDSRLSFDQEQVIKDKFMFLIQEYGFKIEKTNLGNLIDNDGKLVFYGPLNCYFLHNERICINFMHLVQRQDWEIYITREMTSNQIDIRKGQKVDNQYCYNFDLLAAVIKNDVALYNTIFGNDC